MGLFRKKTRIVPEGTLSWQVGEYLNQRQRKLADYLNSKTRNVSATAMLYGLIIFCTVFGSYLIYLLTSAFGVFN